MAGTAFSTSNWSGYDEQSLTNPGSALTDFPLLIDVSTLSSDWKSEVQSDGADIRLTKGDDTELPYDLIDWVYNAGAPTGLIRVKWSGTMASSGTQNVRVWAGYTGGTAVAYDATETYGSDNAYDSSREAYWPNGCTTDRTSNGWDGSAQGGVSAGGATGKIGNATDYDGSDDYADITGSTSADFMGTGAFTFGGWIEFQGSSSLLSAMSIGRSFRQIYIHSRNSGADIAVYRDKVHGGKELLGTLPSGWAHVVGTYDGSTLRLYIDGTEDSNVSDTFSLSSAANTTWKLGAGADSSGVWDGLLNEMFLDTVARSADWIAQEYAQSDSQSTFWGTWAWTASSSGVSAAVPVASAATSSPTPATDLAADTPVATGASSSPAPTSALLSSAPVATAATSAPALDSSIAASAPVATSATSSPAIAADLAVPLPVETIATTSPAVSRAETEAVDVATVATSAPVPTSGLVASVNLSSAEAQRPPPTATLAVSLPVAAAATSAPTPDASSGVPLPSEACASSAPALTASFAQPAPVATLATSSPAPASGLAAGLPAETLAASSPAVSSGSTFALTFDADGTVDGGVSDSDTDSTYYDDCNDTPDGGSADYISASPSGSAIEAWLRLADVPADFGSLNALSIDVDVLASGFEIDTCEIVARIYDSDSGGSENALTDAQEIASEADSTRTQRTVNFGSLAGTKAQWNGAYCKLSWETGGADGGEIRFYGAELNGNYTPSSGTSAAVPVETIATSAPAPATGLAADAPVATAATSAPALAAGLAADLSAETLATSSPQVVPVSGAIENVSAAASAPALGASLAVSAPVSSASSSAPAPATDLAADAPVASIATTSPAPATGLASDLGAEIISTSALGLSTPLPIPAVAILATSGPVPGSTLATDLAVASAAASAPGLVGEIQAYPAAATIATSVLTPGTAFGSPLPAAVLALSAPAPHSTKAIAAVVSQIVTSAPVPGISFAFALPAEAIVPSAPGLTAALQRGLPVESFAGSAPGLTAAVQVDLSAAAADGASPGLAASLAHALANATAAADSPALSQTQHFFAACAVAELLSAANALASSQAQTLPVSLLTGSSPGLTAGQSLALEAALLTASAPDLSQTLHFFAGIENAVILAASPEPGSTLAAGLAVASLAQSTPGLTSDLAALLPAEVLAVQANGLAASRNAQLSAAIVTAVANFLDTVGGELAAWPIFNALRIIYGGYPVSLQPGQTWDINFITRNKSNFDPADADATPTVTLIRNGDDTGEVVTVTNKTTGQYKATVTIPAGYVEGDDLELVGAWAVGGRSERDLLGRGRIRIGLGVGAHDVVLTIKTNEAGTPVVPDCDVIVTTSSAEPDQGVIASGLTDANGEVTFYLDAGTYYLWRQKAGYDFDDNPRNLTVNGDGTYSVT